MVTLILKIDARMAYRLYDEFEHEDIEKNIDGSFTVTALFQRVSGFMDMSCHMAIMQRF